MNIRIAVRRIISVSCPTEVKYVMKDFEEELRIALAGSEEELRILVRHPSGKVVSKILLNANLTEDLVLIIANRRDVGPVILESLSQDRRWRESYKIMLALCRNPRTPQRVSLSKLKYLRIFDLADLTRNPQAQVSVRSAAEAVICEKILSLPLGVKITLARKGSGNVVAKLIQDGMKEVVEVCLESPYITEGTICKIINIKGIASHVIRQIAEHEKWSRRRDVQLSLIRNDRSPLARIVGFLAELKTSDLRELYDDPAVTPSSKPFIYRELLDREG